MRTCRYRRVGIILHLAEYEAKSIFLIDDTLSTYTHQSNISVPLQLLIKPSSPFD